MKTLILILVFSLIVLVFSGTPFMKGLACIGLGLATIIGAAWMPKR